MWNLFSISSTYNVGLAASGSLVALALALGLKVSIAVDLDSFGCLLGQYFWVCFVSSWRNLLSNAIAVQVPKAQDVSLAALGLGSTSARRVRQYGDGEQNSGGDELHDF